MGRDILQDDPVLRVARSIAQLYAWFELHGGPAGDGVHRVHAHLLCHAATDDPQHAQSARSVLQGLLTGELPAALGARAALGAACLDANEVLGDRIFLDAAHSVCEGIVQGARVEDGQALCFSALPGRMCPVHHANLQAAALLARTGRRVGDDGLVELARQATAFALAHQRPDGTWLHGEMRPLRWVDHFHAGARVSSLLELARDALHPALPAALARALRHLVASNFDARDLPRAALRPDEPAECDLLAAAEAMNALARVALADPPATGRAAGLATRLADWAGRHLQAWSLWRDPPSVHGPGRLLEALVRVQALGAGAWASLAEPAAAPAPARPELAGGPAWLAVASGPMSSGRLH
jgi:hypothetical protein